MRGSTMLMPHPTLRLALIAVSSLLLTHPARAELNRADRTAALYSTQLSFDGDNVPVITIAVMEGQQQIRIGSANGLLVLPDGPGGAEIELAPSRRPWEARLEGPSPSVVRYQVVVARIPAARATEVKDTRQRWLDRDFKVRVVELGSVFGFYGRVLDSRVSLVCIDKTYETADEALEVASTLASAYDDAVVSLHEEAVRRATGQVILTDGTTTIRNRDAIWVEARGGGVTVEDVEFGVGFPWHGRETRTYAGRIALSVDRSGRLAAINQVAAEKLLKGLVPAEIYASSPEATLRAQAITARGELLSKIGLRHLADPYLICSDQHCQVYRGVGHEHTRTSAAVDATKGRMLFHGERLVDAVYSSSCGGHSEDNEDVWDQPPRPELRGRLDAAVADRSAPVTDVASFLKAPPDAWCKKATKGSGSFRWETRLTAEELAARVNQQQPIGRIKELRVLRRGVSGRARTLEVIGESGTLIVERELPIRQLLGSLKSAMFIVEAAPGPQGYPAAFVIRGGGFGHGVGMCQTGAIGMGEAGLGHEDILHHYYEGTDVQQIY
ncbi:MAG: hypothetical protein AMXMBFR64_26030 [Myxococcales bacterium]